MISLSYRKILYSLAFIGIITTVTLPDVMFESIHFLFELLFHIVDVSFEWLETLLDKIVEHLFHTERHETQIIVFYLMMSMAAVPLYYLYRMSLSLFFRLKEALFEDWMLIKIRATLYWQYSSLIDKIKMIALAAGAIYLASFLFM